MIPPDSPGSQPKLPAILVVDDDYAHRTILKTLITGWGYEVREADDGAAAPSAAGEGKR